MAHFVLHANDAEAFVKKYGYPDEATPARTNVQMRYINLSDAEVKEAREFVFKAAEARRKGATGKVLRFSENDEGEIELSAPEPTEDEAPEPAPKKIVSPAGTAIPKAAKEAKEEEEAEPPKKATKASAK